MSDESIRVVAFTVLALGAIVLIGYLAGAA